MHKKARHDMSKLGELLRRERTRRGERQVDAAARFGISQASYHRWESGENRPSDEQFATVGNFLGLHVDDVWKLVHHGEEPTSLDATRQEVAELKRDVADLRAVVAELKMLLTSQVGPTAISPPATPRGLPRRRG